MTQNPHAKYWRNVGPALKLLKKIEEYFDHLKEVGYYPDSAQTEIFRKLRSERVKNFFFQFSRNFGKSTILGIDMVFEAGTVPNSKCYIIAPTSVQVNEIYIASGFLRAIIPDSWLLKGEAGYNKTEKRFYFQNGSFIKLDGADNEASLRGYKPTRLGKDESQAWKKEASDSMAPNLLAHDATVIEIGTPPDIRNHFIDRGDYVRAQMERKNPRFYYARKDIYQCPRFSKEQLDELRRGYMERGEEAVWRREFLAEFVPGGASAIFPQFDHTRHCKPLDWILEQLKLGGSHVDYYTISDPSGTRHATLFFAHDRANGKVYVLDETVEMDPQRISVGQLIPRIQAMEGKRLSGEPFRVYDEAAKLFAIEMAAHGMIYAPTQKKQNDKSNNISMVRDWLLKDKLVVADHCKYTISDFYSYHYDERGKIVKDKDDCVDCVLYMAAESNYELNLAPVNIEKDESRRFYTPYQDYHTAPDDFPIDYENRHDDEEFEETNIWDHLN